MENNLEVHAKIIAHQLMEHSVKSENFDDVVMFFLHQPMRHILSNPVPDDHVLTWKGCPPFVLSAVLTIGTYLLTPQDVLMSDELLPAIAAILRGE